MKRRRRWQVVDLWRRADIPRAPGVYVFIKDGRVVYVGQSVNLHARFINYCAFCRKLIPDYDRTYSAEDARFRLPNRMVGVTAKISVSRRYGDWLMRELRLIRRLQPTWNTRHAPRF